MVFLVISFVAGLLTVLAPCVLPLLPVIVGGSLTGEKIDKKKAVTIVISLGISVIAFTFILKVSTAFITIPEFVWTWISGGILVIFGLITLFPGLWENLKFAARLNQKSNKILGEGYQKKSIWGDIIIGASLGPIFSSCSPTYFIVLATVLPSSFLLGTVYLVTYTVGLCLSLLIVAILGQKIMDRLGVLADPKGFLKKVLGILFLLVGLAVLTGVDKSTEVYLLGNAGVFDITRIEQKLLQTTQKTLPLSAPSTPLQGEISTPTPLSSSESVKETSATSLQPESAEQIKVDIARKAQKYPLAPELVYPDGYINTGGLPITLASLRGKVVLLDIWTYSCINCQRTLPYVKAWYAKYKDQGFVVIGIHTPEFGFEKVLQNVQDAVTRLGINYPVILDSEYKTWNAYGNNVWPRKFLIDIDGFVVYDHSGEGNYDETETAIQKALLERSKRLGENMKTGLATAGPKGEIPVDFSQIGSPEIYFGSARNEYLASDKPGVAEASFFVLPSDRDPSYNFELNKLYLGGSWDITPEYADSRSDLHLCETCAEDRRIVFKYDAKNVYMVASSDAGADIEVLQDGKSVNLIHIKENRLYTLIEGNNYGEHTLEIRIKSPGIKAFTFTFG